MKHIKKSDVLRWLLSIVLIYLVFTETGYWTGLFAFLVILESESSVILNRLKCERGEELVSFIKGVLK